MENLENYEAYIKQLEEIIKGISKWKRNNLNLICLNT
jgi:hypothetical protein